MVEIAGENILLRSVKATDIPRIINWSMETRDSYFLLVSLLPTTSEDLALQLNSDSLQLFIVENTKGQQLGLIKVTNIQKNSPLANLSFTMQSSNNNTKLMQEGCEIIIDRLFKKNNIKKIYTQTLNHEREYKQVIAQLQYKKEGTLKEHLYMQNKYFDVEIFGLSHEDYYQ